MAARPTVHIGEDESRHLSEVSASWRRHYRAGALGSALVAHGSSVTVLLLALPFLGGGKAWRASASGVIRAVAAGLTDVVGLLAFSGGGQAGQVAVTAAGLSHFGDPRLRISGLITLREMPHRPGRSRSPD